MRFLRNLSALSLLFTSAFAAAQLPFSGNFNAGAANVTYKGKEAIGYAWSANILYKINAYTSIYTGYGQTRADIPDQNDVKQSFKSQSVPLALQLNVPFLNGSFYVRGGGNYYDNDYGKTNFESGWGVLAGAGLSLPVGNGPRSEIGFTYKDSGSAKTSTISLGANIYF
ncbi:MAG: outer membrane beta-barrel protein [Vibrionaceae bacterium]